MNAIDCAELTSAIATMDRLSERGRAEMMALRRELERAEIVAPHEVPPDVITMNSRAELLDLDTNEHMEFTLVFPDEADIEEGKISVLAPLGTAMPFTCPPELNAEANGGNSVPSKDCARSVSSSP